MASPSIHRIERLNYGLTAVLSLIALFTQPRDIVLGFAVGAGLTCINFYVLRRLVVKWTTDAAKGKPSSASLLMLPKMLGLMGAVAVAVLLLPINVIAFAIGFSATMATLVVVCLLASFVLLAPSIVIAYAVKAADREDAERGL